MNPKYFALVLLSFCLSSVAQDDATDANEYDHPEDEMQMAYELCTQWAQENELAGDEAKSYVDNCVEQQLSTDKDDENNEAGPFSKGTKDSDPVDAD